MSATTSPGAHSAEGEVARLERKLDETTEYLHTVVREHQGQLLYEGNRRGAVFTVVLPPFGA